MRCTRHAAKRAKQRGIPPLVQQWLDEFGEHLTTANRFAPYLPLNSSASSTRGGRISVECADLGE